MLRKTLHTYHISFLNDLFNGLQKSGVTKDVIIKNRQIRKFDIDDKETILPMSVTYEFLEENKRIYGVDDMATEFYSSFKVNNLGEFGSHLTHCKDLLTVIKEGIAYNHLIQTNGNLYLEIKGTLSHFYMVHEDDPTPGRNVSEDIEFVMMLEAIRFILGNDWVPVAISISKGSTIKLGNLFDRTDFQVFKGRYMGFTIKTEDLFVVNSNFDINSSLKSEKQSTSTQISNLLNSYNRGVMPSLVDVASYFNVSSRTLSRALANEGTTFKSLLSSMLQKRAIKLLNQSNFTINEIGQILGYSNSPNFIRAFRNFSGVTPNIYRSEL